MKNKLLCFLLLIATCAFSQVRQPLKGRVLIGSESVGSGLFVINNKTGEETKTDAYGNFSIMAQTGDKIAVYSDKTEVREFSIDESTFKEMPYTVSVENKAYELKEVEINKYKQVNSESLGLVPKGQKQYTPAERKLKTAGDFRPIMLLGILGGGMPLDPVINAINGRTKMLKGALATEKKELLIEKVNGIYTDGEIASTFGIPAENVKGFIYSIIEDEDFVVALRANNTDRVKFLMIGLAAKYREAINKG